MIVSSLYFKGDGSDFPSVVVEAMSCVTGANLRNCAGCRGDGFTYSRSVNNVLENKRYIFYYDTHDIGTLC